MHALSSLGSRTNVSTSHLGTTAQQSLDKHHRVIQVGHHLTQVQQQLCTSNRPATCSCKRNGNSAPAKRRTPLVVRSSRAGQGDTDYQAIYGSLAGMPAIQLRLAAASNAVLTSSEFLFFLRDLEEQARKAEQAGRCFTAAAQQEQQPGQFAQQQQQQQQQQQPATLQQDDVQGSSPRFTMTAGGAVGGVNAAVWRPSGAPADSSRDSKSCTASSSNSQNNSSSSSSSQESSSGNSSRDSSSRSSSSSSSNRAAMRPLESRSVVTAQEVACVAAELVAFREEQELQASSRLLPSLASSLAYDNLLRWRREQQDSNGSSAGSKGDLAVGGVPVEELYKAGEKQEHKLKEEQQRLERLQAQQRPTWASSGGVSQDLFGSGGSSNSMTGFAERPGNEAFREMANMAMARMRSRLVGYNDESDAAVAVLEALLSTGQEWGRAGWADQMHEAFYPPGIKRKKDAAHQPSFSPAAAAPSQSTSQQQQGQEASQYELICTSPEALRTAITARIEERRMQSNDDPSVMQLTELLEDLEDYVKHVWSLRNPLERYG